MADQLFSPGQIAAQSASRAAVPASAQASVGGTQWLAVAIALAGAACMGMLLSQLWLPPKEPYLGTRLYDLYANAILHGRFDLPLRELRLEGHYTPDGTGYLYHGLGPLLTRLPFAAFVEFPTSWIAPLSIWFWAVAGNLLLHRTFAFALKAGATDAGDLPQSVHTLLSLLVWFGAPGILLAANGSLFQEPVAMAYALGSGIVLIIVKVAHGRLSAARALVPIAMLAGLLLHARPHLAAGYYAAVVLMAAWLIWRGGRRYWLQAAGALAVLGLFGAGLIASNALRFGDPAKMHGSFDRSEVQYGWVYWRAEAEDSSRSLGFREYGQFNALRIVPNAFLYAFAPPPAGFGKDISASFESVFRSAGPITRYMRIEEPNVGALFLWPAWIVLMAVGLRQRALWRLPALAGTLGAAIGATLMLSYATITLRYHIDLWPIIALPGAFGAAPAMRWFRSGRPGRTVRLGALLISGAGILTSAFAVGASRYALLDNTDGLWTKDFCLWVTAEKGFSRARGEELCAD